MSVVFQSSSVTSLSRDLTARDAFGGPGIRGVDVRGQVVLLDLPLTPAVDIKEPAVAEQVRILLARSRLR